MAPRSASESRRSCRSTCASPAADARIGFFFVRMGLVPELGSSHFLPRLVGSGRALEWCLTGRMIAAEEAHAGGLVTEVVATEALVDRAVALGEELAARPLDSVRLIRRPPRPERARGDIARRCSGARARPCARPTRAPSTTRR